MNKNSKIMEKQFQIIGKTDGWTAQRDSHFKGKEVVVFHDNLSLKEAQDIMLDWFNEEYYTCYTNWNLIMGNKYYRNFAWARKDGTRGYDYDGRYYSIVEKPDDDEGLSI